MLFATAARHANVGRTRVLKITAGMRTVAGHDLMPAAGGTLQATLDMSLSGCDQGAASMFIGASAGRPRYMHEDEGCPRLAALDLYPNKHWPLRLKTPPALWGVEIPLKGQRTDDSGLAVCLGLGTRAAWQPGMHSTAPAGPGAQRDLAGQNNTDNRVTTRFKPQLRGKSLGTGLAVIP